MSGARDDAWQSIGDVLKRIETKMSADMEEKHRRKFARDCEREGIKATKQEQAA